MCDFNNSKDLRNALLRLKQNKPNSFNEETLRFVRASCVSNLATYVFRVLSEHKLYLMSQNDERRKIFNIIQKECNVKESTLNRRINLNGRMIEDLVTFFSSYTTPPWSVIIILIVYLRKSNEETYLRFVF